MRLRPRRRPLAALTVTALAGFLGIAWCAFSIGAEPQADSAQANQPQAEDAQPDHLPQPSPVPTLTLRAAVQSALERNPTLATFRRNRGIAAAAVQIARQYPFNPIIQDYTWYGQGPPEAGVINPIFNEHTARLDLELRHQGRFRRAMARAALTRTEWEIAAQELLVAVQVTRAFNTLLYRQGKYRLLEEGLQLTDQVTEFTKQLVDQGTLRSADLLLAKADVLDARNALGPARSVNVVAENDLRRALGLIGESFQLEGTLEKGYVLPSLNIMIQAGLERRPDLHALQFAVREAEQRMKLEVANRYGNPSFGPAFEENETSVTFVGMWLIWQLPILNTRRGEIRQRGAELERAMQARHQGEVLVKQDVFAALARLAQAEETVKAFSTEALPKIRQTREEFDKLYLANQPGVDLARVIDIRRRLLRTSDAYLDALFELSQAQTDLAAAVADLSFAGCGAVLTSPHGEAPRTQAASQLSAPAVGEQLPSPTPAPGK